LTLKQLKSTEIILSKEQIAFHDTCHVTDVLSDPLKRKLDLLIILVKQYIYASKYLQKELSLDELVNKLMVQWKPESVLKRKIAYLKNTTYGVLS